MEYKHIPKNPGIYAIVNMINGHFYIGSAVNLYSRKNAHFNNLCKNKHHSHHLQHAYNCYGVDAFRFVIIERAETTKMLIEREQHHIDTLNPEYNICPTAGSALGVKRSEETRKKVSEAKKGKPSPNRGKPMSEAQKAKMSELLEGNTRANGNTNTKGHTLSKEHRQKIANL